MIARLALAALAGEHDAPSPAEVGPRGVGVPTGPAVVVRVVPGQSIQAAVDAATPGSTLALAPGTWRERVIVDRPLVLRGEPGATIDGGGTGTVLTVVAADVTVSGLRVTGGGEQRYEDDAGVVVSGARFRLEDLAIDHTYLGIDLRHATDGVVTRCTITGDPAVGFGMRGDGIRLWESDRNHIEGNRLDAVRDLVVWYSEHNTLSHNVVTRSRYGAHLMHASGNHVEGNTFDGDVVGVFVMYSANLSIVGNTVTGARGEAGVGLGFKESDRIEVRDNVLVGNTTGIYLDTTPHDLDGSTVFRGNLVGANAVGVRMHGPSQGALFEGNTFHSNGLPASVDGRANTEGITFVGNFWSGYSGYDLDTDGIGDLPYEARAVTGNLTERRPALAYFTDTPAAALLELFASAFPMFAPAPVLTDLRPSTRP